MNYSTKCCDWVSSKYRRLRRVLHDTCYYAKCWLFHPYNRIKIKTLPPTWTDADTVIVHAMFQILTDFIDKECSPGNIDWDSEPTHRKVRKTLQELYDWWHNVYLKFDAWEGYDKNKGTKSPFKNGKFSLNKYDNKWFDIVADKEMELDKELTKNLKKLIDIKDYMWT